VNHADLTAKQISRQLTYNPAFTTLHKYHYYTDYKMTPKITDKR